MEAPASSPAKLELGNMGSQRGRWERVKSFTLKAESERLLETAKRAVEIAIETDEQTATDTINQPIGA